VQGLSYLSFFLVSIDLGYIQVSINLSISIFTWLTELFFSWKAQTKGDIDIFIYVENIYKMSKINIIY